MVFAEKNSIQSQLIRKGGTVQLQSLLPRIGGGLVPVVLGSRQLAESHIESPRTLEEMIVEASSGNFKKCNLVFDDLCTLRAYSSRGRDKLGARSSKRVLFDDLVSNVRGALRFRQLAQLVLAHEVLANKDESLMFAVIISEVDNFAVIFESRSSTGCYRRLLESLDSRVDPWLERHSFVSGADSFMGKNAALFHLSSLASLNSSHLPRAIKNLRLALEKAATGPALKFAMLVRDPALKFAAAVQREQALFIVSTVMLSQNPL